MNWTDAQQAVIDSKDQSLLVTAAAGSGKTAVLVERIIEKLTDEKDPWDIDELLVVTFTKAAAKEMKERIYKTLNEKLSVNPADHRIRRMRDRVFSADIRTIDSFCKNVVSEYFSQIDLDPDFRFMDSGETELLKRDVLEEMLREEYENGSQDFLNLSDVFSSKGSDAALGDIILMLYGRAQAYPWVEHYYKSLYDCVKTVDDKSVLETSWMTRLVDWLKGFSAETTEKVQALEREASAENDDGIFDKLVENLSKDEAFFRSLSEAKSFDDMLSLSDTYKFEGVGRAQARKGTEDQKVLADGWKARRDEYKNFFVKKLQEKFLTKPLAEIVAEENAKVPFLHEIIRLTREFDQKFLEEKTDRKSFEFSDIEHFAVKALMNEDGTLTNAAKNYRKRYREVMVDEYQDTNELNEMILSAVSRDQKNYFMVGDVKQSIYGFRNADPGIILRKSSEYQKKPDADFRRIDLDKNFRSRKCVTDTVNDIFRMVMIPEMGGVEYDQGAELKFGADYYPSVPDGQDNSTETVILLRDDDELTEIADEKMSLEATWTAQQIKQLMDSGFQVADGNGGLRAVRYQDIAVILRSTKVNAAKIMEVFNAYGIPAENAADTGYFSAPEVVSTLNYLRLLDNPRQDLPLASVLTSMYVGLSEEDLAIIKAAHPKRRFHVAVLSEAPSDDEDDSLDVERAEIGPEKRKRLDDFLQELFKLRHKKTDTPVYELLAELYSDTGYDLLVSCLPGGERRRQNLLKLYDKAVGFSKTSFSGISAFIAYIERLEKYNADEGEADAGNGGDAVQIMTIHKSKGLEFPVVFALGLGNRFPNDTDQVETVKDSDISMPYTDLKRHTKNDTVHFQMLRSLKADSDLGENLRVLYVALTRAKEKLYLVGSLTAKDRDSLIEKGQNLSSDQMTYTDLKGASCFYKLIIPPLVKNGYQIQTPAAEDFAENEVLIETKRKEIRDELMAEDREDIRKKAYELYEAFTHPYAHEKEVIPKQKYSVSEIKNSALDDEIRDEAEDLYKPEKKVFTKPTIPDFLKKEKKTKEASGAEKGTAMHRFLEKLDFSKKPLADSLDEQIEVELEKGFLRPEQEGMLDRKKLAVFLSSPLAERMQQAYLNGELYREQAFVTGDSPELFFGDLSGEPSDEPFADQVIVQGIIDAFFVENGKIVLIDYKTDFVRSEEELRDKYTKQLQLYELALGRGMDLPVSEMYLYSFALGKTVTVPLI